MALAIVSHPGFSSAQLLCSCSDSMCCVAGTSNVFHDTIVRIWLCIVPVLIATGVSTVYMYANKIVLFSLNPVWYVQGVSI